MSHPPLAGVTALYGGSFDPPHVGHQMACLYLLEALGAEAVWLVPTARHAFAKALLPFVHRQKMAQALAEPFAGRVQVSDVEAKLAGTNTTWATLEALGGQHPGRRWAVVVGADLVPDLPRWHRAEELFARAKLVVLGRAGAPEDWRTATFPPRPWAAEPSVALPDVSSTAVRARIRAGEGAAGLVPCAVAAYLEAHHLYAPG